MAGSRTKEKAKRFFIGFNQTRLAGGYSDLPTALRNYDKRVRHNSEEAEITLMVESDQGTRIQLISNRAAAV